VAGDGDPSIAHLLGRIDVVRMRVAAVVAARRAVDRTGDDPFLGLYLSDEKIDALLRDERVWVADDVAADRQREVETAADEAVAAGARLRLRDLAARFELDDLDVRLLLTAVAPDVDDRFERYYGYLNDDVTRRRVSIGLALGLAGVIAAGGLGRDQFDQGGRLRSGGLIEVDEPDRPFLTRPLRVPDRVTAHLLGSDRPDPAIAFALREVAPTGEPADERLVRAVSRPDAFVYLHDQSGSAVEPVVDAASAAGVETVVIDLERVGPAEADVVAAAAVREARLRGAVLVAGPVDAKADADATFLHRLSGQAVPLVVTGQRGWDPGWARRPPLVLEVPGLSTAARTRIWAAALAGQSLDGFDPAGVTAQYRLGADQIRRAAEAATVSAQAGNWPLGAADLRHGARQQNAARLERLAVRIEPGVSWDDLVLPNAVRDGLRRLAARARHRERVLGEWRMRPGGGRGIGITALFAGDPGTGKTMSAEVVANELGLDLYVVNLATVVDKYIGETEKNLDRIFAESDDVNGVLLFDEADALFGQRSEVRDSHDRYANIEVAYLLQRMETFDGLAVLATNLRSNIDEAFTRRLDIVVDFPMPDRDLRRRLWAHCLAPLQLGDDLDLDFCAESFELSGGDIRAIAITIAYRAASQGHPVRMVDVITAVGQEYRKLGRLCLEAEFGRYYPLLRA
jgi:ATPase family associated with various cellular activities (AAA)/Winged helix domain, variant